MRKMTLSKKLLFGGALLSLIPMLVIGFYAVLHSTNVLTKLAEEKAMQTVEELCGNVQELIEQEILKARAVSAMGSVARVSAKVEKDGKEGAKEEIAALNKECHDILKQLGDKYMGFFLTAKDGTTIAGSRSDGDTEMYRKMVIADRDYFKAAQKDPKPYVASIVKSKVSGQTTMIVYVPMKSSKGEFSGLFCMSMNVAPLLEAVSNTKIGKTGYAFMIEDNGTVIAHPDQKLIFESNINQTPGMEKIAAKMTAQQKGADYCIYAGGKHLAVYSPVGVRAWSIAASQSEEEILGTSIAMRNSMLLIGSIILVISVFLVILFSRSISRPVGKAVADLFEASAQVSSASDQVSTASQQLAEGAAQQAASIEETSSSLEEMASMTRQSTEHAGQANQLMSETARVVTRANDSMHRLSTSMADISRTSEETSKIVKTIDEIAFQTNLLALNAAVEAARAGEAGAGFAVVADEVRNLALRAAEAAKSTATLIEGTVSKIQEGSNLVAATEAEFSQVATGTSKVEGLVREMSAASSEQSQGIDQINRAVSDMDKVVQQNAANAEETAAASAEMNAQAEQMQNTVQELVALVGSGGSNHYATAAPGRQPRRPSLTELPAPDRRHRTKERF
ncbi:MAG: methyl-accepting chemotaxis protein [Desulfobacteraceae bacterium]|nr:methyl-accepting chemotaxis protein [Desulfobacteraceae bacterium]